MYCRWEMGVSHLVLPKLARNVQVLAALACGCWVLSWSFLTACERYHQWVEPVSCTANDVLNPMAEDRWLRSSGRSTYMTAAA